MPPELANLLRIALTGPFMIRLADGRSLNRYQRHALRLAGWASVGYGLYKMAQSYQANKLNFQQLTTPGQ